MLINFAHFSFLLIYYSNSCKLVYMLQHISMLQVYVPV